MHVVHSLPGPVSDPEVAKGTWPVWVPKTPIFIFMLLWRVLFRQITRKDGDEKNGLNVVEIFPRTLWHQTHQNSSFPRRMVYHYGLACAAPGHSHLVWNTRAGWRWRRWMCVRWARHTRSCLSALLWSCVCVFVCVWAEARSWSSLFCFSYVFSFIIFHGCCFF